VKSLIGRGPVLQALFLAVLSLSAVAPMLAHRGLDVVTRTYTEGATRLAEGASPYAPPSEGRDVFKYSPTFALLYRPFTELPPAAHAIAWAFLNALVFWLGVSVWWRASRSTRWSDGVALVIAAMELDISLRYQQVNALLAGLTLLALHEVKAGALRRGGLSLSLAANLKLLPGLFLAGLWVPPRRNFVVASLLGLLAWALLPVLSVGWGANWALHREWVALLRADVGSAGLLDLRTVVDRWGVEGLGAVLRGVVAVVSLGVFLGLRWKHRHRAIEAFPWAIWYGLGMSTILLLSPRTESPTFVLLAPAYVLLAWELTGKTAWLVPLFIAMLSITACYTDLWPRFVWDPRTTAYASKTLGTFLLWGLTVVLALRGNAHQPRALRPESVR
jgi:hypothetical protein